jgi:hypothetical protein
MRQPSGMGISYYAEADFFLQAVDAAVTLL